MSLRISTELTLFSLPFIYYGGWGEKLIELPFNIPIWVQYGIGIIGVFIFILSMVVWYFELKEER